MKNHFKGISPAMFAAVGLAGICASAQAQTINGWGHESDAVSGTTVVDSGSGGNFNISGTPSGNADWRADLPTTASLSVGQILTLSGSMTWATSGAMGGGGLRIGLLDFGSLGTLTSTTWNVTSSDSGITGYWWGLPTGGAGVSNPGGGEITGKPTAAGNAWFSGTGGFSVAGTGNNNAGNLTPNTYNYSLSLQRTVTGVSISYSMIGGSYSETGTVNDNSGNVPLNFNAVGFFANGSDTAFGAPGGVSFSGLTESISTVPEPSSMALLGLGSAVGAFFLRRKKA